MIRTPPQPTRERVDQVARAVTLLYRKYKRPPTVREVGEALGWTSSYTPSHYLTLAAERGLIRTEGPGKSHRYMPITPGKCPLCGHALPVELSA